jgi:hypothetical protein
MIKVSKNVIKNIIKSKWNKNKLSKLKLKYFTFKFYCNNKVFIYK